MLFVACYSLSMFAAIVDVMLAVCWSLLCGVVCNCGCLSLTCIVWGCVLWLLAAFVWSVRCCCPLFIVRCLLFVICCLLLLAAVCVACCWLVLHVFVAVCLLLLTLKYVL